VSPSRLAKPLVDDVIDQGPHHLPTGFQIPFCPAALRMSRRTLTYTGGVIRRHRKQIGSPGASSGPGSRPCWCWPTCARARRSPSWLPGSASVPPPPGGMSPRRVSGPLPGAVHDLTAARMWPSSPSWPASGLVVLADEGYPGASDHVRVPYKGKHKPASQKDADRAQAARLRGSGRTRQRPAQVLAHLAQAPLLSLAARTAGQSRSPTSHTAGCFVTGIGARQWASGAER